VTTSNTTASAATPKRAGSKFRTLMLSAGVVAATLAVQQVVGRLMPHAGARTLLATTVVVAVVLVFALHRLAAARLVWNGVFAVSDSA